MAFQMLARVDEVPSAGSKYVIAGKTPVVLANWKGRVYALSGTCSHQGYPLRDACVWDFLIECPWHHFQFDVRTGENHYPKNVYPPDIPRLQDQVRSLRTFGVEVRDGEIWVDVEEEDSDGE